MKKVLLVLTVLASLSLTSCKQATTTDVTPVADTVCVDSVTVDTVTTK